MASNRHLDIPENVGGPLRGRLLKRSWPVRLVLVAALLLAVPFLFDAGSTVHAADKEISGLTLSSPNPGELVIAWDAASLTPDDYRVMWAPSSGKFLSYKAENTDRAGNAFPTGTTHTVADLPEGVEYKVRVRARYRVERAGPWSHPIVKLTITAQPTPTPTPIPTPIPTPDADADADAYADAYADTDAHTDAYADTDAHTDSYADTDSHTDTDAHTNSYADTDAYADTHAHADSYADTDFHARHANQLDGRVAGQLCNSP